MSKHPINDFPMTLHDPLWLVDKCLEEIKPFLITERGRKLEEKLLGIRHLLEAPEDCRDCHYEGLVCVIAPEAIETLWRGLLDKGVGGTIADYSPFYNAEEYALWEYLEDTEETRYPDEDWYEDVFDNPWEDMYDNGSNETLAERF